MLSERAGQRVGGGDRAEGVGEEERQRAEQARPEDRQRDMAPVLERASRRGSRPPRATRASSPSSAGVRIRIISGIWK